MRRSLSAAPELRKSRRTARAKLFFVAAACLALCCSAAIAREKKKRASKPTPTATPALPIEATGTILGVGIGMSMEEAHEKLDPLKAEAGTPEEPRREKDREEGEREIWTLKETQYRWIIAWAKAEKIVQISVSVRPEAPKPFEQVGDLARAAVNTEAAAMWNATSPTGVKYRLVAKGPDRRANVIYMLTLERDPRD
jgi:hypothetical protein